MPVSYWIDSTPETSFPALDGEIAVDVAVLGAGITGLTAATLLKEAGRTVAVVDAKRIVRGVTGYTTAKLTSGHGLVYATLAKRLGADGARLYAEANQAALEHVARWAQERHIDCDLERTTNYVYTESADEVEQIREEVAAARRAGLPASFTTETPLPFPVAGAVELAEQLQFHPRKYLLPLAQALPGEGSHVFENTRALDVDEEGRCRVETDRGAVLAEHVVVATHIPFLDRGLFFAKVHPHRSYALTAEVSPEQAPSGMFINSGTPTRSVRTVRHDGSLLLLVGGDGHKPGEEPDTNRRYANLETFLRERFGVTSPVTHRWSTQDYMSVDKVPYVGRLTRRSERILVATGFGKWGMSNGTAAALVLADRILGRHNAWAGLYDAKRLKPVASAPKFVTENLQVARHFVGDRLGKPPARPAEDLDSAEGAIVREGGRRVAAYRDEGGTLHRLSPVCTHLRCLVTWNAAERSWDCPCHGSRFTGEGHVIQGPAVDDLRPLNR